MLHFQERRQNELSLTGQLEAMFSEMMFKEVEFFDGFGHGQMSPEIERGY